MNRDLFRREVLTCANEDYTLLYEIVAGLKNRMPSEPETELIRATRKEIRTQLRDGWIQLYRTPSWINQDAFIPTSLQETAWIMSDDAEFTYRPNRDSKLPCYWIGATPLGKSIWRQRSAG